jgi:sugar lactone lactonase YvrE
VRAQPAGRSPIGDGGPAAEATLAWPAGVAVDDSGNVFIAERRGNRIRRVDAATGLIATVAGNGTRGYSGDGGPAQQAAISIPELIALDAAGNLFITDRGNARVRRIDARTGIISTAAGNGTVGYRGDGGPATAASLSHPFGVLVDAAGNLFIADTDNHAIRRVAAATGTITTIAGSGEPGFSGDGGPATAARLNRPHNLAIDPGGNLVIGDSENQRIRRVDRRTGQIVTLYGSGEQGVSTDGIPARAAAFGYFGSLLFDQHGNLLIAGWLDNRVRRINAATGMISSIAGTGEAGLSGDGGPARAARIHGPYGMALDRAGNLFVAEAENNRVRRIDAGTGIITTFAGGTAGE